MRPACRTRLFLCIFPSFLFIASPCLQARHSPTYSRDGMVASAEPHATQAGFEILRAGGNAADAAVAVGFALAVTCPSAGNLGGGGFLVYRKPSGEVFTLDYREKAPAQATRDMFLGSRGKPVAELSWSSLLASGVPGSVAGMLETLERFGSGKLSRQQVLEGAIRLAEEGFPMPYDLYNGLKRERKRLGGIPSTAKVFYPGSKVPEAGLAFTQSDLARTLREIAAKGKEGFYSGWVADSIANFMAAAGGLITREDLAAYRCVARQPVVISYKGYRVYGMAPPSSGGVVLGQMLGLLEPFEPGRLGFNSAAYVNRLVEAERLAYADRNRFLGDTDFVQVPVAELLSREYLDRRRSLMPSGVAGKSSEISHGSPESFQTTHFCVVDAQGGAASVTTTLNGGFGNGYVVPGAGFFLNNEMDDFAAAPGKPNRYGLVQGKANAIQAGKRMLSSQTPTIVTRAGENGEEALYLVLGAAGGPTITTTVLQIFLNSVHFGMNVREAVQAPRFHHQHLPDVVTFETRAFSAETQAVLGEMGYILEQKEHIGMASAIQVIADGWLAGWVDGVGGGAGTGW